MESFPHNPPSSDQVSLPAAEDVVVSTGQQEQTPTQGVSPETAKAVGRTSTELAGVEAIVGSKTSQGVAVPLTGLSRRPWRKELPPNAIWVRCFAFNAPEKPYDEDSLLVQLKEAIDSGQWDPSRP